MRALGPPFIGLTGAIAAGKSETLAALSRLGAATLSTDQVAHEVLGDPAIIESLVERWGDEIASGGATDRRRVGEIVFNQPGELRWLESITHPLVGDRVARWREELDPATSLAVVEVPLLFEAGMESLFDATLVVVADHERRTEWATARDADDFDARSARQLSQAEKAERATFVVANEGTIADLEAELRELWPRLINAGPPA
ncbi:MAG: dephospho-CoA kinase [Actinomycetota bacterium]|nr:dephospho-CoA kinase [Actinomycetota bacterium]